jgi:hypothetical protein
MKNLMTKIVNFRVTKSPGITEKLVFATLSIQAFLLFGHHFGMFELTFK